MAPQGPLTLPRLYRPHRGCASSAPNEVPVEVWGTGKNGNDIRLAGGSHQFSLQSVPVSCSSNREIKDLLPNKAQTEVLWASKSKEGKLVNWPIDHSAPPTTFFKSTNRKCLPDAAEVAVATLHVPVPSPHFQGAVSPTLGKTLQVVV